MVGGQIVTYISSKCLNNCMLKRSIDTLIQIIKIYVQLIYWLKNKTLTPISNFVKSYSKTTGESLDQLFNILTNMLILSPAFVLSAFLSLNISKESISTIPKISIISEPFIVSIILFSSLFILIGSGIYYRNKRNAVLTSMMLLAMGFLYVNLKPPESYVVVIGLVYALGGYVSTFIEYNTPYNHYHIYKTLKPHQNISGLSLLLTLPLLGLSILSVISLDIFLNPNFVRSIIIATGLVAYISSYIQIGHYKNIYKHVDMKTQSQVWILTPQILIILSTGLKLLGSIPPVLYVISILSPCIVGLLFSTYINVQIDGLSSNGGLSSGGNFYTTFTDSHHKSGKVKVRPHENIDVETNFDDENKNARLEFNAHVEIPDKFPEEFSSLPWYEIALITDKINGATKLMKNADENKKKEIEKFYGKVTEEAIKELKDNESIEEFQHIPDSFINNIKHNLYKQDDTDLSDLHYFEVKSERPITKDSKKYIETK